MWMKILFLSAISFTLVESGCFNPIWKSDFQPLCREWWKKALEKYEKNDEAREKCVTLIKEKCPDMIDVERGTITRSYNKGPYEEWKKPIIATLTETRTSMKFYITKTYPVCSIERGTDCYHWWSVAERDTVENEYKERCINRMLEFCSYMIKQVSEVSTGTVQRFGKKYDVKTVTYERVDGKKGGTASFIRYVRV